MNVQSQSITRRKFNFIKQLKCNQRGFTFVEVIVALGLLMIASTGTFGVFFFALQNAGTAKHITAATYKAKWQVEEIKNTTFDYITALFPDGVPSEVQGTTLPAGATWTVTYPDGTGADPLTITVTVSWEERNMTKSVQLTSQMISSS